MLELTASQTRAIEADAVVWTLAFELGPRKGDTRVISNFTGGSEDVIIGGTTYEASSLLSVTPFGPKAEVGQDPYTITMADPPLDTSTRWIDMLTPNYVGIPLRVLLVLADPSNNRWADPFVAYRGRCVSLEQTASQGMPILNMHFMGILAKVDDSSPLVLSKEGQRRLDPNDTFLDYAHIAKDVQFGRLSDKRT